MEFDEMHSATSSQESFVKVTFASLAQLLRQDLYELGAISRSMAEQGLRDRALMSGVEPVEAEAMARQTAAYLVLCGDIAAGTSFGERMLLKRARRTVVLDADRALLFGGHPDEGIAHGLVRTCVDNDPMAPNLSDLLPPLDDTGTAALRQVLEERAWRPGNTIPPGLVFAMLCLGLGDEMHITDEAAETLLDLFPSFRSRETRELDSGQEAVVELPPEARSIVTAGPGSGKTHTASARVARLIERGVAPAGIHLITFTRIAAEIAGKRIDDKIRDISYGAGVQCGTLDSFAWHFLSATSETAPTSHGETLTRATKLLRRPDLQVQDRLARIRHLVIDEAQDIVGDRLALCLALIDALPAGAGITVFGDWAQAIYGSWAGGSRDELQPDTNLHAALESASGWHRKQLQLNHRTQSARLRQMFTEARELLADKEQSPKECYLGVRSLIEDASTNPSVDLLGPVLPWRNENLVLFRSAASAEAGSARLVAAGRAHRLKLSGRTLVANPLSGIICAGLSSGMSVSLDHVRGRLAQLDALPFDANPDDAHEALRQLAGSGRANPSIAKIAEGLASAPLWAVRDHIGTAGPLLGSIHGAKGQEASDVLLMLPPVPTADNIDWNEEARVLFVAATRASRHLHIGHSRATFATERRDGTRWLQGGGLALFGSEGLVAREGLEPAFGLWRAALSHPLCSFARTVETEEWQLVLENGLVLAGVDGVLGGALDYLAADQKELPFGKLRVVGATSVPLLRPDGRTTGVTVLPVLQGLLQGHRTGGIGS